MIHQVTNMATGENFMHQVQHFTISGNSLVDLRFVSKEKDGMHPEKRLIHFHKRANDGVRYTYEMKGN